MSGIWLGASLSDLRLLRLAIRQGWDVPAERPFGADKGANACAQGLHGHVVAAAKEQVQAARMLNRCWRK